MTNFDHFDDMTCRPGLSCDGLNNVFSRRNIKAALAALQQRKNVETATCAADADEQTIDWKRSIIERENADLRRIVRDLQMVRCTFGYAWMSEFEPMHSDAGERLQQRCRWSALATLMFGSSTGGLMDRVLAVPASEIIAAAERKIAMNLQWLSGDAAEQEERKGA